MITSQIAPRVQRDELGLLGGVHLIVHPAKRPARAVERQVRLRDDGLQAMRRELFRTVRAREEPPLVLEALQVNEPGVRDVGRGEFHEVTPLRCASGRAW